MNLRYRQPYKLLPYSAAIAFIRRTMSTIKDDFMDAFKEYKDESALPTASQTVAVRTAYSAARALMRRTMSTIKASTVQY